MASTRRVRSRSVRPSAFAIGGGPDLRWQFKPEDRAVIEKRLNVLPDKARHGLLTTMQRRVSIHRHFRNSSPKIEAARDRQDLGAVVKASAALRRAFVELASDQYLELSNLLVTRLADEELSHCGDEMKRLTALLEALEATAEEISGARRSGSGRPAAVWRGRLLADIAEQLGACCVDVDTAVAVLNAAPAVFRVILKASGERPDRDTEIIQRAVEQFGAAASRRLVKSKRLVIAEIRST